jgi:hypothetical protein
MLLLSLVVSVPLFGDLIERHIKVPNRPRLADAVCALEVSPPLEIQIDSYVPLRKNGAFVQIFGSVTPRKDLDSLVIRFESAGGAKLVNAEPYRLGRVQAGVPIEFSAFARFNFAASDHAAVHVWAVPDGAGEDMRWAKRGTLYALLHRGTVYTGTADLHHLQVRAIDDDFASGVIDKKGERAAKKNLARTVPIVDARPVQYRDFTAAEQRYNAMVGAKPLPVKDGRLTPQDHVGGGYLVQGNVQWTDENGATHPVFGATVEILDDDGIFGDELVTFVGTDVNGNYSAVINNDDGLGAGDRDIFVRVSSRNTLIDTVTTGGDSYEMESPVTDEATPGTHITRNFTAPGGSIMPLSQPAGDAWGVFTGATWLAVYARDRHGFVGSVDLVWPSGEDGSYFNGTDLRIEQDDRWDWDTVYHEYGHFVGQVLNIENNPGGPHNIFDCHSTETQPNKDGGVRLAWGEGWPTYFGTSAQIVFNLSSLNVPRVGDTVYDDLEDTSVTYDLEANGGGGTGEDNEAAVQRLLFDLFDGNNDGRDTISRTDQDIWAVIDGANPDNLSQAWAALRSGQSNQNDLRMGGIATDHSIGPGLTAPAASAVITPANANFSWSANVGCESPNLGDSFDLVFYDASTFAELLSINGLGTTSTSLSDTQIGQLTATTHQVLWAVEGRNGNSPATGPYLGDSRAITVNRPPLADAGTDITAECASHTTTGVQLNGTASSDPDSDTITYSWSAPGVTFDDSTSATPTGQFPEGSTVVTLTVDDGISQDTDTVTVLVQDTTPPDVTCPAPIEVECTGGLGIQADDPQLAPFFAGVSATDLCDSTVTITNDAPAFFPLGDTTVTFTATDDAGNSSSCSAVVTVVDTTPPEITVTLDKTRLWPPNHKLETISATVTVTDTCDPNPTFMLTSITSNEADNGLGDGDTANDIQGADFGDDDTSFQLRKERSGKGNDRVYTITYTASDSSGNTTDAVVTVTVPHQQ